MKYYLNFIFLFSLSVISCQEKAADEVFLIPQGTDVIVLVFDYTHEKNDSTRVYNIPRGGVYYTSLPRTKGILNHKYYFIDSLGNKLSEVKNFAFEKYHNRLHEDEIYRIDMYDGRFSDKTQANNNITKRENEKQITIETNEQNSINYIFLTFGTMKSDAQELRKRANEIVDSIQKYYPEKYQP